MTTRDINNIIDKATIDINAVSYTTMTTDETAPDLAIHISDGQPETSVVVSNRAHDYIDIDNPDHSLTIDKDDTTTYRKHTLECRRILIERYP